MKTVDRAMQVLAAFTERHPEIGLSDLARATNIDKATTRRLLISLLKHGMVEQNANREYRLGPALLGLAKIREASVPIEKIIRPILEQLSLQTGETAHFSLLAGHTISNISIIESEHANRVTMDIGEQLPLLATSSGLVVLAFSDEEMRQQALSSPIKSYSDNTPDSIRRITKILQNAQATGYVQSDGFYENGVSSIASAVFDQSNKPIGAIAVATPTSRFDQALADKIASLVLQAGVDITSALGGQSPVYDRVA